MPPVGPLVTHLAISCHVLRCHATATWQTARKMLKSGEKSGHKIAFVAVANEHLAPTASIGQTRSSKYSNVVSVAQHNLQQNLLDLRRHSASQPAHPSTPSMLISTSHLINYAICTFAAAWLVDPGCLAGKSCHTNGHITFKYAWTL